LLAAKGTRPIRSLDELASDTFESDEELEATSREMVYEMATSRPMSI